MFTKTLAAVLGLALLSLVSCAEAPTEELSEPVAETKPEPEPEGPYYELTKDDITSHPDWTSRNITFMGAKIGDKTKDVEKNFGKLDATEPLGDFYRSIYDKSFAIYTHKMTGELQRIEIYSHKPDRVKDAKLRRLLTGGDLDYMREILGPEEGLDVSPLTTGSESIYDAKGFRFVKYELPGNVKFNALLFSKMRK